MLTEILKKHSRLPASKYKNKKLRICIVSPEFGGLVRNGGIATACTALAEILVNSGHEVTALFTGGKIQDKDFDYWHSLYNKKGIHLECPPQLPECYIGLNWHGKRSLAVYHWLKVKEFDIIHFVDYFGHGYHSIMAKHIGVNFSNTLMCLTIHSPSSWARFQNGELMDLEGMETSLMERRSIQFSDVVISPSEYMIDFLKKIGWSFPDKVFVQPNLLPESAIPNNLVYNNTDNEETRDIIEIVFFGRLEERKGVSLFCDALDKLSGNAVKNIKVVFLGKFGSIKGEHAGSFILRRSLNWQFKWEFLSLPYQELFGFLRAPGRIVVISPSRADNYPYTVYECLVNKVPFIATKVGGIPELIKEEDHPFCLVNPTPNDLAEKLTEAVSKGTRTPSLAFELTENQRTWVLWHSSINIQDYKNDLQHYKVEKPLISVCIPHYNQGYYLKQAISSLEAQDYSNFEVILVDDGSNDPESIACIDTLESKFNERGWKIIRQKNQYVGAARNSAAKAANGEYLLFMDADCVAKKTELSSFMAVAQHTNADILTCFSDIFESRENPEEKYISSKIWVPIGPSISLGLYKNCFGDANAFIKKEVFFNLKGFRESFGVTFEDYEFFLKAVLNGYKLEVIPEALFWYRGSPNGMLNSTDDYYNHAQLVEPYVSDGHIPVEFREAIWFAKCENMKPWIVERRRYQFTNQNMTNEKKIPFLDTTSPNSYSTLISLALSAIKLGQLNAGLSIIKQAPEEKFPIDMFPVLGKAFSLSGEFSKGVYYFKTAYENDMINIDHNIAWDASRKVLHHQPLNIEAIYVNYRSGLSIKEKAKYLESIIKSLSEKINLLAHGRKIIFCCIENQQEITHNLLQFLKYFGIQVEYVISFEPNLWGKKSGSTVIYNPARLDLNEEFVILVYGSTNIFGEVIKSCNNNLALIDISSLIKEYSKWLLLDTVNRGLSTDEKLSEMFKLIDKSWLLDYFAEFTQTDEDESEEFVDCNLSELICLLVRRIQNKRIILFGTGSTSCVLSEVFSSIQQSIGIRFNIEYYVDNDLAKWGTQFRETLVKSPKELLYEDKDKIAVVIASQYVQEIEKQLEEIGFVKGASIFNGFEIVRRIEQCDGFIGKSGNSMSQFVIPSEIIERATLRLGKIENC